MAHAEHVAGSPTALLLLLLLLRTALVLTALLTGRVEHAEHVAGAPTALLTTLLLLLLRTAQLRTVLLTGLLLLTAVHYYLRHYLLQRRMKSQHEELLELRRRLSGAVLTRVASGKPQERKQETGDASSAASAAPEKDACSATSPLSLSI